MKKRRGINGGSRGARPFRKEREKDGATSAQPSPAVSHLVHIEKPIYGGAFLAHSEGKAVFVPLALPDEQAQVRIVDGKRGYSTAEVEEIVTASEQRVAPACPHFGACGGCQYQHANVCCTARL